MKTLNLFLKMHFTSLSPDGQPISLAIVTEDIESGITRPHSFYSEFTDFNINRCDDMVIENVLSRLYLEDKYTSMHDSVIDIHAISKVNVKNDTLSIQKLLSLWLTKFSDYKLNFIVDCGWFTWYKFVELMGEWDTKSAVMPKIEGFIEPTVSTDSGYIIPQAIDFKIGLPKLPANFPPVPIDLNDLIMERKGFKSVADAFNVDREILAYGEPLHFVNDNVRFSGESVRKYNALWDAKVTKAIYEKLK